jgi:RNA polymerase sigma-70 factor (ECF subfamily)
MANTGPAMDTELHTVLAKAASGDADAVRTLLDMHRYRLRRMIASRLDRRLASRLDPSDIVQETLGDAARRLEEYLRDRPLPFYPWLYRLASDRLAQTHRNHIWSTVRAVGREHGIDALSPEDVTSVPLVDRLAADDTTPGCRMDREERRLLLDAAVARLAEADREILGLRYLDQLGFEEIAALLEIKLSAAKMRHLRALERLRTLLEQLGVEPSTAP